MQDFVQEKRGLPFTVPAGGVVSGQGYLIGALFVVAKVTNPNVGTTFAGEVVGVVSLPVANLTIAEGAAVYWDNTNLCVTTVSTGGNTKIGAAGQGGCAAGASSILVILNGTV